MSKSKEKLNKIILPLLLILCFAAVIILQLGFIFIMLAMLPTLVAYFMDNHHGLPLFKTVAACNISALLPVIAPMIEAVMHMDPFDPVEFMSNPMNWLIVFGGAALGWVLILLCRIIGSFIMTIIYEYNIASLEKTQKRLIEEWGQNIKQ
jgi:hypothetical protein